MGLIYTASANNRQLLESRKTTYSVSKVQQEYSYVTGNVENKLYFVYEYRRFCTCQYKYVGMDYQAALQKQNELLEYYRRHVQISDWNPYTADFIDRDGGYTMLGNQVSVIKKVGHLYDVVVSISEEDCRLRKVGTHSPEVIFATENARQYEV